MTEEETAAVNAFEAARKKMLAAPTVSEGAIKSETVYAEAYQGLVRVGLAPQIKAKHRFTEVAHVRKRG